MPLSSLGHVSPAQEPGLILLARVEGLDGGGREHWAGAHRARGHLHPPNSDISLQEWLESLKPTSSLSCMNSPAAAPLSPDCLRPVVNSQKMMCPAVIAAETADSVVSSWALAVCSSLTLACL